jgi:thiamine pyrophosphate-dependent acetolactate synthase large subunit-like protein
MTGGDAIVDSLLRHGIDTIFGLPGVQMYGLFDAFARNANRLKVINARHEQTTAYMALGYAQSTGKPSAFTVVPGPGVMNTMGALTTAWGVNAPIMCITGQVPSAMIGRGRGQLHEMPDQLATLKTLLKFAERIEHPTEAPQVMARAFQAMTSGRPGPVAVEMPWDMFPASADVTPMDPLSRRDNPVPDPEKIAALAKLVDGAKAPMIWIGGGAVDAGAEILALAEKIGAPVVSFRMGKGVVDSRHPLSLNTVGGFELWDATDLLIGIGTRLDVPIARWAPAPAGLKTARIDIDPIEIAAVVVWHVENTAQACFDVENYENYLHVQSETAVRHLANSYAYDYGEEHEITLRSGVDEVSAALKTELEQRLSKTGVTVEEARLTHLAYAAEIAGVMLRRQQAEAIIAARQKIVHGAVSMVQMALNELTEKQVVSLDGAQRARLVSNLLIVLCGETEASPVINTGTLYS